MTATEVILLTKDDCHFCAQAKDVLGRVAVEHSLRVREVRLDSAEGRALAARAQAPFPPVVFLDGEMFSYGRLPERKLRERLTRTPSRDSGEAVHNTGSRRGRA